MAACQIHDELSQPIMPCWSVVAGVPSTACILSDSTIPTPGTPTDVDETQPLPLGGVWGRGPEGGDTLDYGVIGLVTDCEVGQWAGPLGGAAEKSDSEVDLTMSSESSNHPLHDQSLLNKLIYTQPSVRGTDTHTTCTHNTCTHTCTR